jgi:hypothetical protein
MEIKNLFVILLFCSLNVGCLKTGSPFFDHNPFGSSRSDEPQKEEKKSPVTLVTKDPDKPFRPRVFLVLGPGMSRTFAHIGVLKVLSESEIKISGIVGVGWSGLAAAEYAGQGSVHGLEWKLSRSEDLKSLTKTSFWSKAPAEKDTKFVQDFVATFLTAEDRSKEVAKAYFPVLSVRARKVAFSDKDGLKYAMAVPPLFNSGDRYEPYLFDYNQIIKKAKDFGAEKVILIDVLSSRDDFFKEGASISSPLKSYWTFASQALYQSHELFDKVFNVKIESQLTDFSSPLKSVKSGESAGENLVEFLKSEYQY